MKKVFLMLAVAGMFTFAACGGAEEKKGGEDTAKKDTAKEAAPAPAPAPADTTTKADTAKKAEGEKKVEEKKAEGKTEKK